MQILIFAILLPFLAAMILPFIHRKFKKIHLGLGVLLVPLSLFIIFLLQLPIIKSGQVVISELIWLPTYGINLTMYLDGLAMILSLLISGIGTLVVLYSAYYLGKDEDLLHFYIYLLFFMGSMLGVVLADNVLVLYAFWELTSISSFLLIAFWYQRKGSRYGAKKSLMITVFGGFSMLAGFLMLSHMAGSLSVQEIIDQVGTFKNHALMIPTIILILLGAFTKSAQFPFHIWLPDAMEAPTPVSAYLHSATMVKAGIYLVARLTPVFGGEALWFWSIVTVGLLTMFWGAFIAIRQTDLKALLAYSTVSQLGLIMTLLGVSSLSFHPSVQITSILFTQAAFAALFHLINHSTFKGALFMVIGIIDLKAGTRDIRKLGGLITVLPISFTIAAIGAFSMAGLPPFNGFLSKEMFFAVMVDMSEFNIFSIQSFANLFPIIAWTASLFTFIYCMIIVFKAFLGPYKMVNPLEVKEPSIGMLISPVVLGAMIIGIFVFPNTLSDWLIKPTILSIYPDYNLSLVPDIVRWHGFTKEVFMTLGIVIIGLILYRYLIYYKKVYIFFTRDISFDALYQNLQVKGEIYAKKITNFYMTRNLQNYFSYIFIVFIFLIGVSFWRLGAFSFSMVNDQKIEAFPLVIAITIIIAGIMIPKMTSRLAAIIINGYIGFAMSILFVFFHAPDLALTQIVVETVTTALFLLCFYFLPKWKPSITKREKKGLHLAIAAGTGLVFTLVALSAKHQTLYPSISKFYEQARELAGADNIVNTILGDFRAFDTMLEVVVLFIASLGVFILIKQNKKQKDDSYENK